MSILRKILLLAFVISFWFFFYWYRGLELSKKTPSPNLTNLKQVETLTSKNHTKN
jgi:hypothetical protein